MPPHLAWIGGRGYVVVGCGRARGKVPRAFPLAPFLHGERKRGGSRSYGDPAPASVNDTESTNQHTPLPQRGRGAGGEGGPQRESGARGEGGPQHGSGARGEGGPRCGSGAGGEGGSLSSENVRGMAE